MEHSKKVKSLDAKLTNADWTKTTWDMPDITNVDKLLAFLKYDQKAIRKFMKLPVYLNNVDKIPWLKELQNYG